jgi:hypothetical protein
MNAVPYFVSTDGAAAFEKFLDMFKHVANLVGTEHIALGLDYWYRDIGPAGYAQLLGDGRWDKETYPQPPPWSYPEGLDDESSALPKLVEGLRRAGFNTLEIRDIMGGNLLRVFTQAWKPAVGTTPPPRPAPRPEVEAARDFRVSMSTADAVRREHGRPEVKEPRRAASTPAVAIAGGALLILLILAALFASRLMTHRSKQAVAIAPSAASQASAGAVASSAPGIAPASRCVARTRSERDSRPTSFEAFSHRNRRTT